MVEEELDYSGEELAPEEEAFAELDRLLDWRAREERRVAEAKATLEAAEKSLKHVAEGLLPDLMERMGVEEIRSPTGRRVKLWKTLRASLPMSDFQRFEKGCDWLEEHGYGKIIAWDVQGKLDRGEAELAKRALAALAEVGVRARARRKVNHNTLSALARQVEKTGATLPKKLFGVHETRKVVVSDPRD